MTADELKRAVARAALPHVVQGELLGVGTGSTANHFIDLLAEEQLQIAGAVASSEASATRLRGHGIPVLDLEEAIASGRGIPVYVDGADEIDPGLNLIKGGGGALTREKIVAAASECFVCIADQSKCVDQLGHFPLPLEVIPMALGLVSRELSRMGGLPAIRKGFVTDNGHAIIDVSGLRIADPVLFESELDHLAGVVCNGLFARRRADIALVSSADGVRTLRA
ncbi:ribose-5-phosphate isomerase RpiA [Methyloversatilis thermotolerans]|uniref:ribose-5-phosphate isomerase RpiA n=1 Tax=Methyloversatilis thermotolerans TaxID=1346290 RepID=UPI000381EFBA|nr:ribose-5-phosphate isomerase RpiA [Methyloversatilis thermotolerans]